MPGTERSSEGFDARVETSFIGDGLVRGRSWDHLVLPLRAFTVHIAHADRGVHGGPAGVQRAAVYGRGVYRGVYRGCTPGTYLPFTAFTAFLTLFSGGSRVGRTQGLNINKAQPS